MDNLQGKDKNTLANAVARLDSTTNAIHNILFGIPVVGEQTIQVPESQENILNLRNSIDDITNRLNECLKSLESLK